MTVHEGPRPPNEPGLSVVVVSGPIGRSGLPALCERVRIALEHGSAALVICDVGALLLPDVGTVDALARLQLAARRLGGGILLTDACGELRQLIAFVGLTDVLPALRIEPGRQPEQREQPIGVQEEDDPGDTSV